MQIIAMKLSFKAGYRQVMFESFYLNTEIGKYK